MRTIVTVLAAVAAVFLGAGVAAAVPATYNVGQSWRLTYQNGTPTIVPHVEDDVLEVTCRHGDQMIDYKVSKPYLVAGAWPRTDKTGIQVQPEFTGHNERIRITVTCRRS
jgi:hypothetical protein